MTTTPNPTAEQRELAEAKAAREVEERRRAAEAAGVPAPQGSAAAAAALCDEVIADLGDNVRTHGPECYRWHAGCLALRVRQALGTAEFHGSVSARWLAAHDAEVAARQIDAPSVREAIGEVLADMEATAEGTHIASSLALLQEITDAAIRAAVSPPSRTAKRTGYETVGHGVGEHSQKISARAAEYRKAVE